MWISGEFIQTPTLKGISVQQRDGYGRPGVRLELPKKPKDGPADVTIDRTVRSHICIWVLK